MAAPFLQNRSPDAAETGVDGDKVITVDILDTDGNLQLDRIDAYVDGTLVFSGPTSFFSPWDGPDSAVAVITDGYRLSLDSSVGLMDSNTDFSVRVTAVDSNNESVDETYTFRTGNKILSVSVGNFEVNLEVEFEAPITDATITNPAGYTFTNGMYARLAEKISSTRARLWTELFHTNDSFTLTTSSAILDGYGDPIPASYNGVSISPFQSTAHLTNTNGRVRTWRHSQIIEADSERIYIGSTRGIDVFRKATTIPPLRWAHLYDSYGVKAMYLANFPAAITIGDGVPPVLKDQSPAPDSFADVSTTIFFTIVDARTAIDITSVTVYINGLLAFAGGFGGWSNGFSGSIEVSHQELDFTFLPSTSFTDGETVPIRIIATDLLGNKIDTTYQFEVSAGAVGDGFGFSGFGMSPFGGI